MSRFISSYYPPRAKWYSPVLGLGATLRRQLMLDRLHVPPGLTWTAFAASLFFPGYGFHARGSRTLGRVALGTAGGLLLVFVFWLGYGVANLAMGLLISLHVSAIMYALDPWVRREKLRMRILISVIMTAFIAALLYLPAQRFVEKHWLMPLRYKGQVVIVQKLTNPGAIRRGDWIGFTVAEASGDGVIVMGGYGFGPVLAVAGDKVQFTPADIEVNGAALPRQQFMPAGGEFVVPEKQWFVWSQAGIMGHGQVAESQVTATMVQRAMVGEHQFVGRPFKRWFWRRQVLETGEMAK